MRVTKKEVELVNENIPNVELLVIDDEGNSLGKMSRDKAIKISESRNMDLVVVSPDSKVVVAKMMDYSKYRFEQQKRLKEMRKKQTTIDVKEIRLSPTIGDHDFNTKLNHAKRFIKSGDKVKISIRFRGRMVTHSDIGFEVVNKFIESLGDSIIVESKPKLEGMQMIAVVAPNNN
ncbi:MAG TPA: translation initiation factor IF-3 [Acholeplasma sp.]|nr:translation initiation factor IF-3 [Acholeplasma sp.]